jgi:succinate dehydrogenase/fumarate reductase flavoprotein subunit
VSAGGHDRTLFQWRIVGDDDTPPDYGAATGRGAKAQMAAARERSARRDDEDDAQRQHRLSHQREMEVVGASKDLRVELRVRELKMTIKQQEDELQAKQDEIQALQLMLFEQESGNRH